MKITDFEPAAPVTRIGSSTDSTALAGVTIIGGSPYPGQVLIALGSNSASWQSSASNSVSFGSNSTDVSSYSTGGTIASNSRADHIHRGVHLVTANASNTLYGDVNLAAGSGISLAVSGQTATISALDLATDAELATHAAAADPHTGYVLESLIDVSGVGFMHNLEALGDIPLGLAEL